MGSDVKAQPLRQPQSRMDVCASGRPRAEVREELERAKRRALEIDGALYRQKVEICRKEWDIKYKGQYPFNPEAAYTSLISGERLDQDLCNEFFDLNRMIYLLGEELSEPLPRGDRG